MKVKKIIYAVLIVLPVVFTLFLLPSMPEQVPIHYGVDYLADRWGSKYEVLVSPLICTVAGLILYAGTKYASKQEKMDIIMSKLNCC